MIMLVSAMIGCTSHPEKEAQNGNDSITNVQSGPGCAELEDQIDSLNHEISILKKEARKNNSETSAHKKNTQKADKTESASSEKNMNKPAKISKPQVKDQDRDASVRCSFTDKSGRCKKRTFSPNGLCWQHGGN